MAVRRHDDRHGCVSLPTLLTLRFYHYSIFNKRNIMQRILPPPVAKLCLALLCLVLFAGTMPASAQTQKDEDKKWSYPTSETLARFPFDGGDGTQDDPIRIRTAQQLANFAYMVNEGETFKGKYFLLTDDIVLNEGVMTDDGQYNSSGASKFTPWTTIGAPGAFKTDTFEGFFDGGGHTIYGFYQNFPNEAKDQYYPRGFFGCLANAIISNLTISHSYLYSTGFGWQNGPGFFCGEAENTTFSNCHVVNAYFYERTDDLRPRYIGGLLARGTGVEIKDCTFDGQIVVDAQTIRNDLNVGGLVGHLRYNANKVTGCKTSGSLKITENYGYNTSLIRVGGQIGYLTSTLTLNRCLNAMDIEVHKEMVESYDKEAFTTLYVGGIGGYWEVKESDLNIGNCVNLGNITVGGKDENLYMQDDKLMLSGIATVRHMVDGLDNKTLNVSDCANYGNLNVLANVFDCEKPDEQVLAAGCCGIESKWAGNLNSEWTRCISVSDGNDLTPGGKAIRFAPIMQLVDRVEEDAKYIKSVNSCYYYTNITGSQISIPSSWTYGKDYAADKSSFKDKTPFTVYAVAPWTFLTADDSEKWNGYAVPYTPFFTMTKLSGKGTADEPYLITNEKELYSLNTIMSNIGDKAYRAHYRLEKDLDMSNMGAVPRIYNSNDPTPSAFAFYGTFDGHGHYINGLRLKSSALFHHLGSGAVVKNLVLTNFRGNDTKNSNTSIAMYNSGTIEDCSVFGTISSLRNDITDNLKVVASGIAGNVYEGGVIRRCAFKGTLKVSPKMADGTSLSNVTTNYETGGITNYVYGTVEQCYASFDLVIEDDFNGTTSKKYGIGYAIASNSIQNCAYVCDAIPAMASDVSKCASEADITLDKLGADAGSVWKQGAFRPVNTTSKHLTVTDPAGQPTYLDLCPDDAWTPNKVYTLTLSADNAEDRVLQQFKNLALYNLQSNTAYIINLELDREKESFDYTPAADCTATKGATTITLKKDDALTGAPGHYLLCLPCPLRTADLPAGSQLHGLGYFPENENKNASVFYLTECDSVGAGVPCHVYIPDCKTGDYTLLSYGDIVTKPQGTAEYGPQGYFTKQPVSKAYTGITLYNGVPSALTYTTEGTEVKIFGAAAKSSSQTGEQALSIVRVLDENDPYLHQTLHALNTQSRGNLYVKRALVADEWNTLTLPFSIDADKLAEKCGSTENFKVQTLSSVTTENGGLVLNFADATTLEAGVPYLVKPTTACNGFNLTGRDYVLTEDLKPVTKNDGQNEVSMIPYYVPLVLVEGDYFLQGNKFYVVAEGMTVKSKGLRARFTANAAASEALQSARLVFDNGDVTGIDGITPAATNGAVYDLSGRRVEKPAHGLYIVNGRKVLLP